MPTTLVSEAMSQTVWRSGAGASAAQSIRPALTCVRMPRRSPMTAIAPGKTESRTPLVRIVRSESSSEGVVDVPGTLPSPVWKNPGSVIGARPRNGIRPASARAAARSTASPRP